MLAWVVHLYPLLTEALLSHLRGLLWGVRGCLAFVNRVLARFYSKNLKALAL